MSIDRDRPVGSHRLANHCPEKQSPAKQNPEKRAKAPADIESAADIDRLMADFYGRLMADPIIGYLFTDIARIDLTHHLPVVAAFWRQQLFGDNVYHGRPLAVHQALSQQSPLQPEHFHRWLYLFETTLGAIFQGPRAEAALQRARRIAGFMQERLIQPGPSQSELRSQTGASDPSASVDMWVPG